MKSNFVCEVISLVRFNWLALTMADVRFNVVDVASCQLESMQNVEDELLVQEVQKYHCVWNISSRAYKENPKK